ncbi:MAG TPA: TonB-dependent receptor [Terricaulis sp.]|nr:TonB-dependent receptor [Terricaulis sp.]
MTKRIGSVKPRNILQYSTALGVMAFAAALTPAAALAQDGVTEDDAIVVTGTRIRQPDFEFSNPVASVDAQTIQQSGATNLTDFARDMPALTNSFTTEDSADTGNGGGLQGQNLLDLRSLGTNRTLVLVDGRRHVAGLEGSAAVDINTIPIDMIERIEVLTGGASAVYGADGVTGVVNFVMRTDFEGFQVRGQHGWTEQGGGGSEFLSALWGMNFAGGRGNVMVGAEYSVTHALDYWERDIIAPGNAEAIISGNIVRNARYIDTSMGGSFLTDCDGDYGFFYACATGADDPDTPSTWTGIDYNGDGSAWTEGTYVGGAFMQGGDGSRLEDFNDQLIPDLDRWTINARSHFDITNRHRVIGEFKWAHTETYFVGQPTYDFGTWMFLDNPFMPASIRNAATAPGGTVDQGEIGVLMLRDNFDLGTLDHDVTRDTFRAVVGLEGSITDWLDYNISYTWGTTVSDQRYRTRNNERWLAAIDVVDNGAGPVCRDNAVGGETWAAGTCVPMNVFGNGVMSQASIDWVMTNMYNKETITQSVLTGFVSGTTGDFRLPGGPIAFVLGAEYREEESEFDFDDYAQTLSAPEDLFWNGQGIDSRGAFHVSEAFAEVSLPLLRDMPLAENLTIDGAYRISNYSSIGSTETWKAGVRYSPTNWLMLRGTMATAVRAPNITELYLPQQITFGSTSGDPCDTDNVYDGTPLRVTNCIAAFAALGVAYDPDTWQNTTSTTIPGLTGGNPNLKPEEAETITYGFVFEPGFLPGLSIALDYWDIELTDAVQFLSLNQMAGFCYDFAQPNQYCTLIERTPSAIPAWAIPAGGISDFTSTSVNVAAFTVSGYDLAVRYMLDPADWGLSSIGRFHLALNVTKLESWEFQDSALAPSVSELGRPGQPEWQAVFDATWQIAGFTVNYGYSWFDETERRGNVPAGYETWSARSVHDLYVAYDFMSDRVRVYGGVNNFTEQKPDRASVRAPFPVNEIGRTFFVGASARF